MGSDNVCLAFILQKSHDAFLRTKALKQAAFNRTGFRTGDRETMMRFPTLEVDTFYPFILSFFFSLLARAGKLK